MKIELSRSKSLKSPVLIYSFCEIEHSMSWKYQNMNHFRYQDLRGLFYDYFVESLEWFTG